MNEKRCRKCGEVKPLDEFHKNKSNRDGLQTLCKDCAIARRQEYYLKNGEKVREARRIYYAKNAGKENKASRAYYLANKDKNRQRCMAWRAKNREKVRELKRAYRAANPGKDQKYKRAYRATHLEKEQHYMRAYYAAKAGELRERSLAYRTANLEKVREYDRTRNRARRAASVFSLEEAKRRRRARERNTEGTFAAKDIMNLYDSQGGCCAYCSKPLNGVYHIDHVVPLSRGGTNWPANLALACEACNLSKSNKLVHEEWEPPNPLIRS